MLEWLEQLHWGAVFQIVLIDVLLGGDNAVVIALACRRLERRRRLQGILWGTAGAIVLRVALIAFALTLLVFPGLKIAGALLLLWIGVKLLLPDDGAHGRIEGAGSVWAAVRTIIIADFVMSLDNVIAIAGAAQNTAAEHQMAYVVFGLLMSVPIIVWGSTLVLKLIDRYPLVVTLGAGLLGWIAGGMLVTDALLADRLAAVPGPVRLIAEIAGAVLVMGLGTWLGRRAAAARTTP
ncbi:TerC family protein [Castellaniella defragrans]|uniref:Membrane protein TerC n=2 Tax=Castellaniella defragrans TaxID=75697 RepID=W8WXQ9_CASD6|nr:TerC family protein [Castellaniella defragrans]KAB0620331.1 TerC family protein [Castellaniella defragrans]MBB6084268.1 YjbE family integral membrane protein [Castellaniella defragrans]CDM24364.1 Membrane protein TerC [Castellaniella defragrans 65Phen]